MEDEVRCQRRVVFALDDEDGAFAELDDRAVHLAGEAADLIVRRLVGLRGASETLARTAELPLHPDATFIDHTPAGWGVLNTAGYLDLVRATSQVAENFTIRLVELPAPHRAGPCFAFV